LNKGGFTLVELLVALSVLLSAVSGAACLYRSACRSHDRAVKLSSALYQARVSMEAAYCAPGSAELETVVIDVPPVKLYSLRSRN
jgi:prepilin-type N-terminal cleavage/methylation domain-containing protein